MLSKQEIHKFFNDDNFREHIVKREVKNGNRRKIRSMVKKHFGYKELKRLGLDRNTAE